MKVKIIYKTGTVREFLAWWVEDSDDKITIMEKKDVQSVFNSPVIIVRTNIKSIIYGEYDLD